VSAHPASMNQRLVSLLERYRGAIGSLNVISSFHLHGPLDLAALEVALTRTGDRHEALRTTLRGAGARLEQVVHPARPVAPLVERVRAGRDAAARVLAERCLAPVDLRAEWPLRCHVASFGRDDHLLALMVHHAATDGWSQAVVVEDLAAFYTAAVTDTEPELPPAGWQYRDFSAWQAELLGSERGRASREFWRDELAGAPPLELFDDGWTGSTDDAESERVEFALPAEVGAGLRAWGRANRATPFTAFMAAVAALLHEHTGQRDLVVPTMMANRLRRESQRTVGFLANLVPVRLRLGPAPDFGDLVSEAKARLRTAIRHQELPPQLLAPTATRGSDAPVTLVFQLLDIPAAAPSLPGVEATSCELPQRYGSRFDLELETWPDGGGSFGGFALFSHRRFTRRWAESLVADLVDQATRAAVPAAGVGSAS